MANATLSAESLQLVQIRRQIEVELARLERHRLHEKNLDSEAALAHLAKAGVLTRRFAGFLRKLLRAAEKPTRLVTPELLTVAPEALAVLRIVPNRRA
jgi:hypothetical protein